MNGTVKTASSGFPLVGLLTIIFVLAKIFGYINWSWWWVFSPVWISLGLFFGIVGLVFLIMFVIALLKR